MICESLVIVERGARFPTWIDEMAGNDSSVRVIAQRERESEHAFEARVLEFLERFTKLTGSPHRAVLACVNESGRARTTSRAVLILALRELVHPAHGNVIVSEPHAADASIAEVARMFSVELVRETRSVDGPNETDEIDRARVA